MLKMARLMQPLLPLLPQGAPLATYSEIRALSSALSRGKVTILSGAGLSTESGLRDYRSPGRELRRKPMTASEFASSATNRKRYWARSFSGYDSLASARPNRAHRALALLHRNENFGQHVTQNVDGLLQLAGAPLQSLIELHGSLSHAACEKCGASEHRAHLQRRMAALNEGTAAQMRPDGDAEVHQDVVAQFVLPNCGSCRADALAPEVVFHGGCVPRNITAAARRAVDEADVVWVLGSTLTTYSAFSLVLRAKKNGAKVVAVNYGSTRADDLIDLKLETLVGDTVDRVVCELVEQPNNQREDLDKDARDTI